MWHTANDYNRLILKCMSYNKLTPDEVDKLETIVAAVLPVLGACAPCGFVDDDRDLLLARALHRVAAESKLSSVQGGPVLGLVGAGHLLGIARAWHRIMADSEQYDEDYQWTAPAYMTLARGAASAAAENMVWWLAPRAALVAFVLENGATFWSLSAAVFVVVVRSQYWAKVRHLRETLARALVSSIRARNAKRT
jgi:pheromone shutdown protein TraB